MEEDTLMSLFTEIPCDRFRPGASGWMNWGISSIEILEKEVALDASGDV